MMQGESSALFTVGDEDDSSGEDDELDVGPFGTSLANSGLIMGEDTTSSDLFSSTPLDLNETHGDINQNQPVPMLPTVDHPKLNQEEVHNSELHQSNMDNLNSGMGDLIMDDPMTAVAESQSTSYMGRPASSAPSHFYRSDDPFSNTNTVPYNQTYSHTQMHTSSIPNHSPSNPPPQIPTPLPPQPPQPPTSSSVISNYRNIQVTSPRFFSSSSIFSKTSGGYWMYQIITTFPDGSVGQVQRRYSHFVSLENRLKECCPGAILPPKPDKKNNVDESSLLPQSPKFAKLRAIELQKYLTAITTHPYAATAPPLQFFLTVPDIGSIWPDVSDSTMTRLSALGSKAVVQLGEKTTKVYTEKYDAVNLEDDAEIIALVNSEELRLQAIEKTIPSASLLIKELMVEHADIQLALGMEASKCSKNVKAMDNDVAVPLNVLSSSILRDGRLSKRTSLSLESLLAPYWREYRGVENTRSAMNDRKNALLKLYRAKSKSDYNAAKLLRDQTSLLSSGKMDELKRLEDETQRSDEFVSVCEGEVQEVGDVLKGEVRRLSEVRRREFSASLKQMATEWNQCCAERKKVWESAKQLMEES